MFYNFQNDIATVNLQPGKLFKLSIWPSNLADEESRVPYVNKLVKSTCGCPLGVNTLRATEPTGKPSAVLLTQVLSFKS